MIAPERRKTRVARGRPARTTESRGERSSVATVARSAISATITEAIAPDGQPQRNTADELRSEGRSEDKNQRLAARTAMFQKQQRPASSNSQNAAPRTIMHRNGKHQSSGQRHPLAMFAADKPES